LFWRDDRLWARNGWFRPSRRVLDRSRTVVAEQLFGTANTCNCVASRQQACTTFPEVLFPALDLSSKIEHLERAESLPHSLDGMRRVNVHKSGGVEAVSCRLR
jgi:hypothetical protein